MGTNYYLRTDICSKCGRHEEQHIGKSSAGWAFLFQGTDTLRSYKDWLLLFEHSGGKIYDEYGEEVELHEFITMVKNKKEGKSHAVEYPDGCWLDKNGYSFCEHEFS